MLTSVVSLANSILARRWATQDALREGSAADSRLISDRCREAAHDYLVTANGYYRMLDEAHERSLAGEPVSSRQLARDAFTAMQDAYVYLTISTGAAVRTLAHEFNLTLYALHDLVGADPSSWDVGDQRVYGARNALREAVRAELGVRD